MAFTPFWLAGFTSFSKI